MIRCNCGEMLPLTTTGPAHVCNPPRSPSSPVPSSEINLPRLVEHAKDVLARGYIDSEGFARALVSLYESSRPPSRGTEPEDFEKLLETLISKSIVRGRDAGQQGRLIYGGIESRQKAVDEAAVAIRGYVSRLQSENRVLRSSNDQYEESLNERHAEIESLRSQLSRIQQTGLTRDEAETLLLIEKWATKGHRAVTMKDVEASALAKLRSLAALRSLEGEGE